MEYFDPGADLIREGLPSWWATDAPGSEVSAWVTAFGELVDELAVAIETIVADQTIGTASDEGLRSQWAPLYGVSREDLPLETETLRGYLRAIAAEDGSIASLEESLLALLRNSANDVGTIYTFPLDGSGYAFPADGSDGLPLFQPSVERGYLRFAADGSGITFPEDGSGLTFPTTSRLEIAEAYADHRLDVTVRAYLSFDRPAFARAVARFRQAHMVPPTITETAS